MVMALMLRAFHKCTSASFSRVAAQLGLVQIGIDILLLLSSERNFAVRLNKVYMPKYSVGVAPFVGNYADLMILVCGWPVVMFL
jgi:hypothetical protein